MSIRLLPAVALAMLLFAVCASSRADSEPVRTVELASPAVGRTLKYNIALPPGYEGSDKRYPVIYLLHGFSGNYTQWTRWEAPRAAAPWGVIVVMPDGGNSWWINWARSDAGQSNRWEDYLVQDLIPHIDATYRTIATRAGRAIGGVSMGGYGAMVVGLHHPDLFCSISSNSGALKYAQQSAEQIKNGESLRPAKPPSAEPSAQVTTAGFSSQLERTPQGDPFVTAEDCAQSDPVQLVLKIPRERLPHLSLDCGTEDTWMPHTREFVDVLIANKLPYTYSQSPGEHHSAYWRRELDHSLSVQATVLQRNLKAATASNQN